MNDLQIKNFRERHNLNQNELSEIVEDGVGRAYADVIEHSSAIEYYNLLM
jgi:hypothetical protein